MLGDNYFCEGQLSIFDLYETKEEKKEVFILDERKILKEIVLKGTGFLGGKQRVKNILSNCDKKDISKKIKEEYGIGGCGWPLDNGKFGLHGYHTFSNKGIKAMVRTPDKELEIYYNWNEVSSMISELNDLGTYYTEIEKKQDILRKTRDAGLIEKEEYFNQLRALRN